MDSVIITHDVLNVEKIKSDFPLHTCCGATVQFEGVVRNENHGKKVISIEYECFEAMAKKEFEKIISEAKKKWPIHEVLIAHRVGKIIVGEVSLVVFVCAPHRLETFEASQYIIDTLKKCVPIWKKEFYEDGKTDWVGCSHAH